MKAIIFYAAGLFDDYDQDLNYYKDLLENHIDKKMICTNPDLIVDKGSERELCAGIGCNGI
jgi:ribonucleotide monophosphatase NagD (HAD superfamily)